MPELKLLQEELEQVIKKRRDLREKYRDDWTDDASREESALHERGMKLQIAIEEEKKELRARDFDRLEKFMHDPEYRIAHPVNSDNDGRKTLMSAGWEIKNGMIFLPTSTGQMLGLLPEEVLFGPLPKDSAGQQYYKQMRAITQPDYREVYVKYLRLCAQFRSEGMAFVSLNGSEQKALSEGSDPAGGFLVPPDMQAEILARTAAQSIVRRLARVVNTSRDRVVWPRVLPNATNGSIYSSGFVGAWVGETPAFTETDPTFSQFEISIKKARAATRLSNDLIADAVTDIVGWLVRNGSENLALVEDAGFLTGSGSGNEPLGILNDPGVSTIDVEGSTSNTISNSTSNTGSAPKLIDLVYAVPGQYAERAQFVMRRAIEGKIRKLVDADGRFMWPDLSGSGFAATPRSLMGAGVNNSEWMPNDGTDGNKVLLYGDLSNFIIAQRAQITTMVLRERFADTDQTGIILFERVGGALWNPDAVRIGVV